MALHDVSKGCNLDSVTQISQHLAMSVTNQSNYCCGNSSDGTREQIRTLCSTSALLGALFGLSWPLESDKLLCADVVHPSDAPFAAMKMNRAKDRIIRQGLESCGDINYKILDSSPGVKDLGRTLHLHFTLNQLSPFMSGLKMGCKGVLGGWAHPTLALPKAVIASLDSTTKTKSLPPVIK